MKFKYLPIWVLILICPLTQGSGLLADTSRLSQHSPADPDSSGAELISGFSSNLDSLLNLWYIKNVSDQKLDTTGVVNADTTILYLTDSILLERIANISSAVELTYNSKVRTFIELYTTRRKDLVGVLLGLSEYYFPIFEEKFAFYDIPMELKYCSIIESALNPRAVSRAGAAGIWQFMYGTGKMYGLTINSFVDERLDPVKSTDAAARLMKDLYDIYGDWILVIAAYNCGPGNVNKAIRRSGGKKNYWDIYYYLPRETRGHVPAFIAAVYFMNYYREHNLYPLPIGLPVPVDTIMVTDELHIEQVSHVLNIPAQLLRDLNPQYKWGIIPGNEKPYALKLPQEFATQFIDLQDSIFAYNDSLYFNENNLTKNPGYSSSKYLPEPPSSDMESVYYTVKSGDNLGFIAEWYNVRLADLKYWNNIYGYMIRTGEKLVVYVPKSKLSYYKKINSMSFEEKQKMIGKEVKATSTPIKPSEEELQGEFVYYTVKPGDTLWDIARKFDGVSDTDIMRLNNISDASKIQPGQQLKIKKKG